MIETDLLSLIGAKYTFGDEVYLKTDLSGVPRMVVGVLCRSTGIQYGVQYADGGETWHYDFELCIDCPVDITDECD